MIIKKSRTLQIKQYEPMTVEIEEECTAETMEGTNKLLDEYIAVQVKGMELLREGLK